MSNPHKIKVGQELFFGSTVRYAQSGIVTVVSVGRQWAKVDKGPKVNLETLYADGGGYTPNGRYWLSKQDHDDEDERLAIWRAINKAHGYSTPRCSLVEMKQVAALLKVGL